MRLLTFVPFFILCSIGIANESLPWIPGNHDGREPEFIASFLPENPIILEAGGHYGEDTERLSLKWPKGLIYTFEPNPEAYTRLEAIGKYYNNIKTFPFGIFSHTGYYTFNLNPLTDGSSSLFNDNKVPGVTWYQDTPITVFCKNLDEWAEENGVTHIDYMWLDMEGAEYLTLLHAPKILDTVSVISTEVNFREFRKGMAQFSDIAPFLISKGFTLYKIWGNLDWQGTAIFIRNPSD